ncbi:hypothetical protein DOTSEDRAFT_26559 [Dothistroma septosporum NZE10]|uniref:Uncharacterized protein n=1 Tax=Dothistroma septosporum (strain NZE10 / CBS 128990) TaxID=675120 RepID=N1PG80_DOTSN|nr:hypothetical protein DOTSEDRAFT_26559 [Dothistroma septosporum NZE10]
MFRNLSCPGPQPLSPRRRHPARQERGFESGSHWARASTDFDEFHGDLDLSIHHTTSQFSVSRTEQTSSTADPTDNRFGGLATPPPAHVRARNHQPAAGRRRPRNSRGTKQAKKRRDARRNERKHAVQMLDEQLSKDIDEILANACISTPPRAGRPLPTPIWPTTPVSHPPPELSSLPPLPPTPPQLPALEFNQWDTKEFPSLTWQLPSFAQRPSQLSPIVPDWCPYIPSLMSNRAWSGKVPSFTDLSHLPERKPSTPKIETQRQLRPWTTDLVLRPRKQSRFFPTSQFPQPIVKLPPTACNLHRSDQAMQKPLTTAWNLRSMSVEAQVTTSMGGKLVMPARDPPSSTNRAELPSAANLWHILINEKLESLRPQIRGSGSCWETEHDQGGGVALPATPDEQTQPFELDSRQVPYVHTNSLTGHANDTARYHLDCSRDQNITDTAIHSEETFMARTGATSNHELAAMPWPLIARLQTPHASCTKTPELHFIDNADNGHTNTDADDLARSTDQLESEQSLFGTQPSPVHNNEQSTCDLATFLKMEHVGNCWCTECCEEPELVDEEPQSPICLNEEEEEGWMTWDSTEDESTSLGTAPSAEPDQAFEDEKEIARHPCIRTPEWDELYPCVPKQLRVESLVGTEPEEDAEFLGYYDDGPALARGNDYDWLWAL